MIYCLMGTRFSVWRGSSDDIKRWHCLNVFGRYHGRVAWAVLGARRTPFYGLDEQTDMPEEA